MKNKPLTIDEYCKVAPGTFKKYINKQEEELRCIENERKERIKNRKKLKNK